jgi:hypothetical protein
MDEETALVLGVQLLALCCIACSLVGTYTLLYMYSIIHAYTRANTTYIIYNRYMI